MTGPFSITAAELVRQEKIPPEFIPARSLIYNSPATLAYNSPGALGFGVKRAGLLIPGSVMLLISPGCCGRNSTILSVEEKYADRMFYLLMQEADLVTGRHLSRIPDAIREIVRISDPAPEVVVLCSTCVDALLGTDLERVARKAQEETGVRVVPSYMYALEREGRKPPMTAIRQTIYSLLERKSPRADRVNLTGFFLPVDPESELLTLLRRAGARDIRQVSSCRSFAEYQEMGDANFNLVLDPECVYAAEDLRKRLGMPYIEFPRLYAPERIHRMYRLLGQAVGSRMNDQEWYDQACRFRDDFSGRFRGLRVSVGEMIDADPFDLAATLAEAGLTVVDVFAGVTEDRMPHVRRLAKAAPDARIYTGVSPTMLRYQEQAAVDLAVGKDASGYHPGAACVLWQNQKMQPFGYRGLIGFFDEAGRAVEKRGGRAGSAAGPGEPDGKGVKE